MQKVGKKKGGKFKILTVKQQEEKIQIVENWKPDELLFQNCNIPFQIPGYETSKKSC